MNFAPTIATSQGRSIDAVLLRLLLSIARAFAFVLLGAGVVLAQPVQTKTIRVVGDDNYPPFLFRDEAGRTVGYVADWWKLWEQKTGVRVELKATEWAEAQKIIARGDADVIDNIFRTPEREPLYDFTAPYATVPVGVFVHASIAGINDVKGMRGFQVGVMNGDACVERLRREGIQTLRLYKSYLALIQGAQAGDVRMFCLDDYPANYYLSHEKAQTTFRKAFQLYEGQFHRAVPKGHPDTLGLIERGAAAVSAAEDKALRDKWMPPSPVDRERIVRISIAVLGGIGLLAAVLLVWVLSLRGAVRRQTATLKSTQIALQERMKEQQCLHAVFRATENLAAALPEVLRDVANVLPPAWLYPEVALASVEIDGEIFSTGNLAGAVARLEAVIRVEGAGRGRVTVAYTQNRPSAQEGPFLAEERMLIDAVAQRLAGILQRREAEARLREAEERFRTLFENTRQPITLVEDGRFIAVNKASLAMLGMDSPEQLIGRTPCDISPVDQPDGQRSSDKVVQVIQTALEGGSHEFEWEHIRANGERFTVNVLLTAIRLGGKELLHVVWNDITERIRAESKLADREKQLRSIGDNLPNGFVYQYQVFEGKQQFNYISAGVERTFGIRQADVMADAQVLFSLIAPDSLAQYVEDEARSIQELSVYSGTLLFIRPDGGQVWMKVQSLPRRLADGRTLWDGVAIDVTTSKQAELELRRYKAIVEFSDDAIIGNNLQGSITSWNRGAQGIFGYTPEEAIGTSMDVLLPPDRTDEEAKILAQILQGETVDHFETIRLRKDGGLVDVSVTISPIRDENGMIVGASSIARDITEHKRVEAQLEESHQLLETVLNNVDAHIYMKDADGIYLYANHQLLESAQLAQDQVLGRRDADIFPADAAKAFAAADAQVLSTGQVLQFEEQLVDAHGERQYYWSTKFPLKRIGKSDCLIGLSTRITALKVAEEAMARSEARFRTLFESSSEAVMLMTGTHFLDCNDATLSLLGVSSKAEFLKLTPVDLSPPMQPCGTPSDKKAAEIIENAFKEGSRRVEVILKRYDDGGMMPVEITATAIELDNAPTLLITLRDLTERKRYEEQINRLAFYDALTQLPNRRLLYDRLSQALVQHRRSKRHGCVIYLDLDNFKPLNDHHGHIVGDLLLQEVARRLVGCVRAQDTVARLGGDEFVTVLIDLNESLSVARKDAIQVAEQIRAELARPYVLTFQHGSGAMKTVEHHCTASLGVAIFRPTDTHIDNLLRCADDAMYRAKAKGRNQIQFGETWSE